MEKTTDQNYPPKKPVYVGYGVKLLYVSLGVITLRNLLFVVRGSPLHTYGSQICALLLFGGLLIILIRQISAGKNWARITWLVLFLASLLYAIPSTYQSFSTNLLLGIFGMGQMALEIIALVFLFLNSSNEWFKYQKIQTKHEGAIMTDMKIVKSSEDLQSKDNQNSTLPGM